MTAQNTPAEPMFYVRLCSDNTYEGPIHASAIERVRVESGAWSPLYLAASPQPAAQQPEQAEPVGERELEDLAHGANQEALAYGVNFDVFMRLARTVAKRAAAPQAPSREPLRVEQIADMLGDANRGYSIELGDYTKAVRDTERAHGITKEGAA